MSGPKRNLYAYPPLLGLLLFSGCSEYAVDSLQGPPSSPKEEDTGTEVLEACATPIPSAYSVSSNEDCRGESKVMNFEPLEEWNWGSNPIHPGYHMVMMMPVVGDIDGDGHTDIVFVAYAGTQYTGPGALTAISGKDGSTLFSYRTLDGALPNGVSQVAIADTDGDGVMTIFVHTNKGLASVEPDGDVNWFANAAVGAPAIADLEGDGIPEIITSHTVLNADGSTRWSGAKGTGNGISFPVDLDGDGRMEVIAGNTVYNYDGSVRWTFNMKDCYPAVADMDGDGVPEVVAVSSHGLISIWREDGTVLHQSDQTLSFRGGPPTIADYDGDGEPEIGIAGKNSYRVFDSDLSLLWSRTTEDDSSSVTGSAVFDFEGDGSAEVVYADEHTLYIYDGLTGAVEMSWDNHASGTLVEYPVIADVDGDGSAEIVVASNNMWWSGNTGVTVIGDAIDGWVPAREIWNQHAYSITNINDDGTVPKAAVPNWSVYNTFRAGNSETFQSLDRPDLSVGAPELCTDLCEQDRLVLYIPLENSGMASATTVDVAIYTNSDGSLLTTLQAPIVDIEMSLWVGPIDISPKGLGADGFWVAIDDDGTGLGIHDECNEDNNIYEIGHNPCLE